MCTNHSTMNSMCNWLCSTWRQKMVKKTSNFCTEILSFVLNMTENCIIALRRLLWAFVSDYSLLALSGTKSGAKPEEGSVGAHR